MNSLKLAAIAVLSTGCLASFAGAQVVSAKEFGSGVCSFTGSPDLKVNYAVVRLNSDHTFAIQVFYKTETTKKGFSGKWRVSGPHDYILDVSGAGGQKATGSGHLRTTPDEQDFSKLSLSGTGKSGPFNVTFDSSVAQRLTAKFSLDEVEHGTGTLNVGSNKYDLRTAWLRIKPEGNFDVRLMGDHEIQLQGHWQLSESRSNRIHLEFMKGPDGQAVTGNGTAVLERDRRGFMSVQIDGTKGGDSFAGHFNTVEGSTGTGKTAGDGKVHSMGPKMANAEVDTTQVASGTYTLGNQTMDLSQARVILMPNGKAIIATRGHAERLFEGHWSNKSSNEVQINILDGYHNATGKGNVVLDHARKKFTTINLNGKIDGLDFTVYAKAN